MSMAYHSRRFSKFRTGLESNIVGSSGFKGLVFSAEIIDDIKVLKVLGLTVAFMGSKDYFKRTLEPNKICIPTYQDVEIALREFNKEAERRESFRG